MIMILILLSNDTNYIDTDSNDGNDINTAAVAEYDSAVVENYIDTAAYDNINFAAVDDITTIAEDSVANDDTNTDCAADDKSDN